MPISDVKTPIGNTHLYCLLRYSNIEKIISAVAKAVINHDCWPSTILNILSLIETNFP